MVDLMLDLPRHSSSSVTQVLGTDSATFKTLLIVCILSDRIPKSFYVSVYEIYPVIQCTQNSITAMHFTSPVDVVCLISRNRSPLLVQNQNSLLVKRQNDNTKLFLSYFRSRKSFKTKQNNTILCHKVMLTAPGIVIR